MVQDTLARASSSWLSRSERCYRVCNVTSLRLGLTNRAIYFVLYQFALSLSILTDRQSKTRLSQPKEKITTVKFRVAEKRSVCDMNDHFAHLCPFLIRTISWSFGTKFLNHLYVHRPRFTQQFLTHIICKLDWWPQYCSFKVHF